MIELLNSLKSCVLRMFVEIELIVRNATIAMNERLNAMLAIANELNIHFDEFDFVSTSSFCRRRRLQCGHD